MKGIFVAVAVAVLLALGAAEAFKSRKRTKRKREKLAALYAEMLRSLDRMPVYGPSDSVAFLFDREAEGTAEKKALTMIRKEERKVIRRIREETKKEEEELKEIEDEDEDLGFPGQIRQSDHAAEAGRLSVRLSALASGRENIENDLRTARRCMNSFSRALEKARASMSAETAEAASHAYDTAVSVFEKGLYANRNRDQAHNRIREEREKLDEAMCHELCTDDIILFSEKERRTKK